jgi:hypothetical protein
VRARVGPVVENTISGGTQHGPVFQGQNFTGISLPVAAGACCLALVAFLLYASRQPDPAQCCKCMRCEEARARLTDACRWEWRHRLSRHSAV